MATKGSVSQSTCESVPTADIKSKSSSGSTVIVPVTEPLHGLPVVVSSQLYTVWIVISSVGVPEIVATPEATFKLTPAGNPVTVAPVAPSTRS